MDLSIFMIIQNDYENLLGRIVCREMDFTGKPMKGFLFIYPEGSSKETDWDF